MCVWQIWLTNDDSQDNRDNGDEDDPQLHILPPEL